MSEQESLFRKEVLEHRAKRLHGEVNISLPVSWHLISYSTLVCFVVTVTFLAIANYAQIANVSGQITLDKGVAHIVPSRTGIVTAILVKNGQHVKAGQSLVHIVSGEYLNGNVTAPEKMLEAMKQQDQQLKTQIQSLKRSLIAQKAGMQEQINGLNNEIINLTAQITAQKHLDRLAQNGYSRSKQLVQKGLTSKSDLETSEATFVSRKQGLAQLQESLSDKRSALLTDERQVVQYQASTAAQIANIESSRAQIAQQIAQIQSEQGYALVAPFDGIATSITAKIGQPTSQQPLMLVVPKGAKTEAQLDIPTQSAGFLKVGQQTRLLVDAFPYASFGTVPATIKYISTAATTLSNGNSTVPVYLVTVSISHPWIMAFGEKQPLVPGMTLSARIVTRKQSLLQWLFEPLFAVENR